MPLRRLLNVGYAALAEGRDDDALRKLDDELEARPGQAPRPRTTGNFQALLVAAKMPQRRG
jgi:hypothetical protein